MIFILQMAIAEKPLHLNAAGAEKAIAEPNRNAAPQRIKVMPRYIGFLVKLYGPSPYNIPHGSILLKENLLDTDCCYYFIAIDLYHL